MFECPICDFFGVFQVPEDDESIYLALERESRVEKQPVDHSSDSAVQQKALVVDISRALGLDFEKKNNRSSLSEQLRLMRKELPDCKHECELELLKTVARLLESLVVEPEFVHRQSTSDIGENEPLPPFEAFLCPLTKQVRLSVKEGLVTLTFRTQIIRAMCQDCSFPVSCTTSHTTVFCKKICEYLQLSPGGKKNKEDQCQNSGFAGDEGSSCCGV
jgi:hypothetical protein